jgi:hypothetical protein
MSTGRRHRSSHQPEEGRVQAPRPSGCPRRRPVRESDDELSLFRVTRSFMSAAAHGDSGPSMTGATRFSTSAGPTRFSSLVTRSSEMPNHCSSWPVTRHLPNQSAPTRSRRCCCPNPREERRRLVSPAGRQISGTRPNDRCRPKGFNPDSLAVHGSAERHRASGRGRIQPPPRAHDRRAQNR